MCQRRWNPRPTDIDTIDSGEIAAVLVFIIVRWLIIFVMNGLDLWPGWGGTE